MIVIKEFYIHSEKRSYKVGELYEGKLFENHKEYLQDLEVKEPKTIKPKAKK